MATPEAHPAFRGVYTRRQGPYTRLQGLGSGESICSSKRDGNMTRRARLTEGMNQASVEFPNPISLAAERDTVSEGYTYCN